MQFKCCVCGSNKQLHKFPKNAEMKQKWANVLRKMGIRLDCHSRVCSDHFLDSDFYRKSNPTGYHVFKNYLWTLAVPSVFSCNSRSNVHEPPNFGKGEIIFGSQPHSVGPTFSLQDVFKNDTFRVHPENEWQNIKEKENISQKIKKQGDEDSGIGIKPEDEMEEDMLPGTSVQGLKVNETNNILIKQDDFCNVVKECCFWITENHQPFLEEDPIFPKQRVEEIDVEINDVDHNDRVNETDPVNLSPDVDHNDRVNETDPVSLSPSNEIIAVRRSHRAQTAKRSSSPSIERKNYNFRLLGDLDYRGVEETDVEIDHNNILNETDSVNLSPRNEMIAVRKSHIPRTAKRSWSPSIERKNYKEALSDYNDIAHNKTSYEKNSDEEIYVTETVTSPTSLHKDHSPEWTPRKPDSDERTKIVTDSYCRRYPSSTRSGGSLQLAMKNRRDMRSCLGINRFRSIKMKCNDRKEISYESNCDEVIDLTEAVTSPTSLHEDHSPERTPRKPDSDERTKIVTDSCCWRCSSSTRSGGSLQLAMKNRRDMRSCLGINRFRSIKMKCNDHKEISYESNCDEVIDLTEAVTSPTSLHEDHSPEPTPRKPDSDERTKTVTDTFCSQYASKKKDRKRYFERYNRSYDRRNINVIMERNRRSELNQLFDNLRHILPKASNIKIKILHEAVECIRNMQYEHRQLARKLQIYRKKHHSLLRHRAFFDLLDDAF